MSKNYYEILGVSQTATQDEIKRAFRTLAKKYHPDVNSDINATEKMQEIIDAYEILSNLELRKRYDIKLRENNKTAKSPQDTSYYQSYTYTKEESESDFEEWLKELLDLFRRSNYADIYDKWFNIENEILLLFQLFYNTKKDKNSTKNEEEEKKLKLKKNEEKL